MEPITDREIMIKLDSNVSQLRESINSNVSQLRDAIERFAKALENLEMIKIKDHEDRITKVERFVSEWSGAYKIIAVVGLVLGIIATIKVFIK